MATRPAVAGPSNAYDDDEFADAFDDADLILDEATEQSLQQIENAFATQRLSQRPCTTVAAAGPSRAPAMAPGKRARSPSIEFVSSSRSAAPGGHGAAGSSAKRANLAALTKESEPLERDFQEERERERALIDKLMGQLLQKDQENERLRKEVQSKTGEVETVRRRLNTTLDETGKLLLQKEEAIQQHNKAIALVKQTNEALVTENKTLKAFRQFEVGTNAIGGAATAGGNPLWSSVTASVARRRAGTHSAQRDYSQSHSQTLAATIGLTTPTRRQQRQAAHAAALAAPHSATNGAGSSGGPRPLGGSPGGGEESPSSRARRRQMANGHGAATPLPSTTKPRKPQFPGFVNSFAKPVLAKETQRPNHGAGGSTHAAHVHAASQPLRVRQEQAPFDDDATQPLPEADEDVFQDHALRPASPFPPAPPRDGARLPSQDISREASSPPSKGQEQGRTGPTIVAEERPLGWSNARYRFTWAVKAYTLRQTSLAALLLSHTSFPCRQAYSKEEEALMASNHGATLQRILHANLPAEAGMALRHELGMTNYYLLHVLSHGPAIDAEDRFVFLLQDDTATEEDLAELWTAYLVAFQEGMSLVLEELVIELRLILAIACKASCFHLAHDAMVLMRSIALHFDLAVGTVVQDIEDMVPTIEEEGGGGGAGSLTQSTQTAERMEMEGDDAATAAASTQRRQYKRLETRILTLLLSMARWALSAEQQHSQPSTNTARSQEKDADIADAPIGERILTAMLDLMTLFVQRCHHNDHVSLQCTFVLKSLLAEPGLLSGLLADRRRTKVVRQTLSILTQSCRHDSLWRVALACPPPTKEMAETKRTMTHGGFLVRADDPRRLLTILAGLLVDREGLAAEPLHQIHRAIIVFLQQLVLLEPLEGMQTVVESDVVLAAVIRCLHLDSDLLWNETYLAHLTPQREEAFHHPHLVASNHHAFALTPLCQAVDRICMDVRLLTFLYRMDVTPPTTANDDQTMASPPSAREPQPDEGRLARQLASPAMAFTMNGVRHAFVVAMSRIAFAAEPLWIEALARRHALAEQARVRLNDINEPAADLLELVLTPDEMEACWEALVEEDEEEEEEEAQAGQIHTRETAVERQEEDEEEREAFAIQKLVQRGQVVLDRAQSIRGGKAQARMAGQDGDGDVTMS